MTQEQQDPIVEMIGADRFAWLTNSFSRDTKLSDMPLDVLEVLSQLDAARRDLASDPNAITGIALLTFAYGMAGKRQEARHGSNDLMLVKIMARNELDRRSGKKRLENPMWSRPVVELITGEVGDRIRAEKLMTNPVT